MNIYIPYTRLPSAYQEVEYIESSGTQYFIVGSTFKTSYKTVIDFQMTATGGDYVPVGVRDYVGSGYRYILDAWEGYFKINTGGSSFANTIVEDTNRHTITIDKSTAIVDGTSYSVPYIDHTFNGGVGVFVYNRITDIPDAYSRNKLYKLDIYDENGTHIYDLVPCYRKSDSVIGLYDLVNDQFYTNSGTGTFSKGNDVYVNTLKNIYIGEYGWKPGSNTVAYYPFKNNTNDVTGNTTLSGTMVQDGLGYKPTTSVTINLGGRQPMFIGYWINILSRPSSNHISSPISENIGVGYYLYHALSSLRKKIFCFYNSSYAQSTVSFEPSLNTWHHLAMGYDGTKTIYAIDGVVGTLYNGKGYNFNNAITVDGGGGYYIVSDLISETECWTAEEIQSYYNQTKSNYGL